MKIREDLNWFVDSLEKFSKLKVGDWLLCEGQIWEIIYLDSVRLGDTSVKNIETGAFRMLHPVHIKKSKLVPKGDLNTIKALYD